MPRERTKAKIPRCACGCGAAVCKAGKMTRKCRGRIRRETNEKKRALARQNAPEPIRAPKPGQTVRMTIVEALRAVSDSFRNLADAIQEDKR